MSRRRDIRAQRQLKREQRDHPDQEPIQFPPEFDQARRQNQQPQQQEKR